MAQISNTQLIGTKKKQVNKRKGGGKCINTVKVSRVLTMVIELVTNKFR